MPQRRPTKESFSRSLGLLAGIPYVTMLDNNEEEPSLSFEPFLGEGNPPAWGRKLCSPRCDFGSDLQQMFNISTFERKQLLDAVKAGTIVYHAED